MSDAPHPLLTIVDATWEAVARQNTLAPGRAVSSGVKTGVATKPEARRAGGQTRPRGHTERFGPAGGATRERAAGTWLNGDGCRSVPRVWCKNSMAATATAMENTTDPKATTSPAYTRRSSTR